MRDYLEAIRKGVVVYDGGMGATLEQFDLTQEDYGGLQGKCHEALILNRPDGIQGGPARSPPWRSPAGPPRSRERPRARAASWRARSARPATCPPATTRRWAR